MILKKPWFGMLLSVVLLTSCNPINDKPNNELEVKAPSIIEVEIQTTPEKPLPGDDVQIEAKVTQAGNPVDDANDVSFEIWEKNNDEHETIVAEHSDKGAYSINKVFEKDGVFNIVAHVTARDQHTMPKIDLVIGDPTSTQEDSNTDSATNHQH
jgi:hypothetical protein